MTPGDDGAARACAAVRDPNGVDVSLRRPALPLIDPVSLSTGTGLLEHTVKVKEKIDGSASYMMIFGVGAVGQAVQGVRVGSKPPP